MFRKRIYSIIEKAEDGDKLSTAYDFFMIIVIVLSLVPLAFKQEILFFIVCDKAAAVIFIIDYILR